MPTVKLSYQVKFAFGRVGCGDNKALNHQEALTVVNELDKRSIINYIISRGYAIGAAGLQHERIITREQLIQDGLSD